MQPVLRGGQKIPYSEYLRFNGFDLKINTLVSFSIDRIDENDFTPTYSFPLAVYGEGANLTSNSTYSYATFNYNAALSIDNNNTKFNNGLYLSGLHAPLPSSRTKRIGSGNISFLYSGRSYNPPLDPYDGTYNIYSTNNNQDTVEVWGYRKDNLVTPVVYGYSNFVSGNIPGSNIVSGQNITVPFIFLDGNSGTNYNSDFYRFAESFSGILFKYKGIPSGLVVNPILNLLIESGDSNSDNVNLFIKGTASGNSSVNLVCSSESSFSSIDLNIYNDPVEKNDVALTMTNSMLVEKTPKIFNLNEINSYYNASTKFISSKTRALSYIPYNSGFIESNIPVTYSLENRLQYPDNWSGLRRQFQNSTMLGDHNDSIFSSSPSASHKYLYFSFSYIPTPPVSSFFTKRIFDSVNLKIDVTCDSSGLKTISFNGNSPLDNLGEIFTGTIEILLSFNAGNTVNIYVGNCSYPMYLLGTINANAGWANFGKPQSLTGLVDVYDSFVLHHYMFLHSSTDINKILNKRGQNVEINTYLNTEENVYETVSNQDDGHYLEGTYGTLPDNKNERLIPFILEPLGPNFDFSSSKFTKNNISLSFDISGNYSGGRYLISGYYGVGGSYPIGSGMTSGSLGWNYTPDKLIANFSYIDYATSGKRITINPYSVSGMISGNSDSGILKLGVYPVSAINEHIYINNIELKLSGSNEPVKEDSSLDLYIIPAGTPENNNLNLTIYNQKNEQGLDLFIKQQNIETKFLNLNTRNAVKNFDSLNLYSSGNRFEFNNLNLLADGDYVNYDKVNLVISGIYKDFSNINLVTDGDLVNYGSLNLYTSGFFKDSNTVDLNSLGGVLTDSKTLNLHTYNYGILSENNSLNLNILSDIEVFNLDLFTNGITNESGITNLYIANRTFESTVLDLMIKNTVEEKNLNLSTFGKQGENQSIDLSIVTGLSELKAINLYTNGTVRNKSDLNLFTSYNPTKIYSSLDFFLDSENNYNNSGYYAKTLNLNVTAIDSIGDLNLFISGYSESPEIDSMNLFINAQRIYSGQNNNLGLSLYNDSSGQFKILNLYNNGAYYENISLNLFIDRNDLVYNSVNLTIGNDRNNSGNLYLYQSGMNKISDSVYAYTSGKGFETNNQKIFIAGF